MARKKRDLRTQAPDAPSEQAEIQDLLPDRNEELKDDPDVRDACLQLYKDIEKGFMEQWERSNSQLDYWDIYNCELGPKQFYSGNSKIFVPIVADAIDARKTRFTNQIFPTTGKNVEVVASEDKPQAMMSLLEHYIRKAQLRSVVVPTLLKNGDVEGQYNLYLSWVENERHVAYRVTRQDALDEDPDVALPGESDDDEEDSYEDIEEETVTHAYPHVEVLPDADVLILPFTATTVDEAVNTGGSVTVLRRYTKARIEQLVADGEIEQEVGDLIKEQFKAKEATQHPDKKKKITDAAGITGDAGKLVCYMYETWTKLTLTEKDEDGEEKKVRRICRIRYASEEIIASCRRNPYWCDQVPVISAPSDRTEGSGKGRSRIKRIETMQYAANDAVNEGMDTAAYALLPIVMTDPLKNPRTGSMILNVAAIWETNPNDTKFAQFPALWKDAFEIVNACKQQIFQSLGVNPAMLPSSTGQKGKTNQAQVAQEQQIDLLMTADVVTGVEADVLTPVLRWFVYLDHQFRKKELTLRQFGELGHEMNMEAVPPVQMDRRFEVRWFGVEAMRSVQQMQQQMAGINVIRGIPPQQYEGFALNLAPVLQQFMENLFGPVLARRVFTDLRSKMSMDPEFENQLLAQRFQLPVSPYDDDQEHIKKHLELYQEEGDPSGAIRTHMMLHSLSMQKKMAQAQQQGPQQQGAQGVPGGVGPGVPGQPRQGARTGGPRGGQGPAGMIHQDQMRDAGAMPRARGAV